MTKTKIDWKCTKCNRLIKRGEAYADTEEGFLCIPCYDIINNKGKLEINLDNMRPRSVFTLEQIRLEELSLLYSELKLAKKI